MFPSMEVKWFREGAIPPTVWEWFQQRDGQPETQPCRVDYYLRVTDRDSLGIKLREGRIEIKQRHRQYGVVRFDGRVAGLVEQWHKWGFELTSVGSDPASILGVSRSWIGVKKERRLYRYRVTSDQKVVAVPATGYPVQGCQLELTRIGVEERTWWSLGFEAFGDVSTIEESLFVVARQVLAAGEPPALEAKESYGYPKWLQIVEEREAT